ncbi:liprin-beta-1 isoform X4 [Lingula anatina]|uniref:Liprin-beta-1 isoform X4 n=1 Tax=Lingula anatina TaxID=7574 RepID=A0A1S3JG19_LINAN|nr:liprin-beta-1 isoform X4 [Lingula anatina]|eukprot:XP_013409086.1 liprin-beta-1 isoform X4 [Lingula anatina]
MAADQQPEDVNDVLAQALQEMDGIIRESGLDIDFNAINGYEENPTKLSLSQRRNSRALQLVEDLRDLLETSIDKSKILEDLPIATVMFLKSWFDGQKEPETKANGQLSPAGNTEDTVRDLHREKENLELQVGALTDQVDMQSEKIRELERTISNNKAAEGRLQNELISRSTLETHKLDLMAEISALKLRLATAEKQRTEWEAKFTIAQRQIQELQELLRGKDADIADLKTKLSKNGTISSYNSLDSTGYYGSYGMDQQVRSLERERTLERLKRKHTEVDKLKRAVESLMVVNEEKERKIEELKRTVHKYKKLEELVAQIQGRKVLEGFYDDAGSDSSSTTEKSTPSLHEPHPPHTDPWTLQTNSTEKPTMPHPNATSTPEYRQRPLHIQPVPNGNHTGTPPSAIMNLQSPRRSPGIIRSNSAEDIKQPPHHVDYVPKTPPASKKFRIEGSNTLPKDPNKLSPLTQQQQQALMQMQKKNKGFSSFGKGFLKIKPGKWSTSAPNLAQTEMELVVEHADGQDPQLDQDKKKQKGIKRLFGKKVRRTGSQDTEGGVDQPGEFRRGGLRATAGARLGIRVNDGFDVPFSRKDGEQVALWLHEIGLTMYIGDCKRWVKNGAQLLKATPHDLEKEMGVRNPLHRKKLCLALQALSSEHQDMTGKLTHEWVTRWLDDIGLPQYKDAFSEARVDGRMLHYMTVDDLIALKVTNELHHISIKRGIQVLRLHNYNPNFLKRRPAADEGQVINAPEEVMLWSNHRVMEWLRTIDLSEYAPNLRGSGVHGALLVLEPRFQTDLLATLLSIPANKTLLRRHLNTHFISLIGNETQCKKRDYEMSAEYVALTASSKVKAKKRSIFKRSKSEMGDGEDYLCPLELSGPIGQNNNNSIRNGGQQYRTEVRGYNTMMGRTARSPNAKTVKEIGAMSQDINTLTDMLAEERFLQDDSVPTSDV